MPYDFDQFCADCRRSLQADPGTAGREAVREHMEKLLAHPEFLDERLGPDITPGTHKLWEDPETGINILAHVKQGPTTSPPHDHGSVWAVYGNLTRHTDVTLWRRTDEGGDEGSAAVEPVGNFRIETGKAGLFDAGVIHSIDVPPDTRFLRVEGSNLDNIKTHRFDRKGKTVIFASRRDREQGGS